MRPSEALARHRDEVLEIISRYPVRNPVSSAPWQWARKRRRAMWTFCVDRIGRLSYFNIFRLEDEIKSVLGCQVEVFTILKPHVAVSVAPELRAL